MRALIAALSIICLSAICLSAPALAGPPAASGSGGGGGSRANVVAPAFTAPDPFADQAEANAQLEDTGDPRDITLPVVVAPLVHADRLTGYAFITARLRVAEGTTHWDVRDKLHFALDEMVRAVHASPLSSADGLNVDSTPVVEILRRSLADYYGEAAIGAVEIITIDTKTVRR